MPLVFYYTSTHIEFQVLGSLCQSLLVEYGLSEAGTMGPAFHGFLTTVAACVLTTFILLISYVFSPKSQNLIRQSSFVSIDYKHRLFLNRFYAYTYVFFLLLKEFLFSACSCFLYLSAAAGMAAIVHIRLYPYYVIKTMYSAYPAMTAVYVSIFRFYLYYITVLIKGNTCGI